MATWLLVAIFLLVTIGSLVIWAVCLKLGLRWIHAERVTTRNVVATVLTIMFLQLLIGFLGLLIPDQAMSTLPVLMLAAIVNSILVPIAVIMHRFRVTAWKAFLAYLLPMASIVCQFVFVLFVLRSFIVEAYTTAHNSMAPTILGRHVVAKCPKCGQAYYTSPPERQMPVQIPDMICGKFHITQHDELPREIHGGDRFLVCKLLKPQRWDLIVFRMPADPRTIYVKRLVGLPGEKIVIQDGAVWANDQRLEPPDQIRGITYLSELPDDFTKMSGTAERPATLEADEYFVLGDFTSRSYDSRLWHRGQSDRNPYAVPASHVIGVVSTIYWLPERWRIFR